MQFEQPRILSIACGHLREGMRSAALTGGRVGEFVAFDQDADSLAEVERAYAGTPGCARCNRSVREILAGKVDASRASTSFTPPGCTTTSPSAVAERLTRLMFDMVVPGGRRAGRELRPRPAGGRLHGDVHGLEADLPHAGGDGACCPTEIPATTGSPPLVLGRAAGTSYSSTCVKRAAPPPPGTPGAARLTARQSRVEAILAVPRHASSRRESAPRPRRGRRRRTRPTGYGSDVARFVGAGARNAPHASHRH